MLSLQKRHQCPDELDVVNLQLFRIVSSCFPTVIPVIFVSVRIDDDEAMPIGQFIQIVCRGLANSQAIAPVNCAAR